MTVPALVSFAEVKEQLDVDHDNDDAKIERIRVMAISAVLNYMKQYERGEFDTLPEYDITSTPIELAPWPYAVPVSGLPPFYWPVKKVSYRELPPYVVNDWMGSPKAIPEEVRAAVLLVARNLYDDPAGEKDPFSLGVKSLLAQWRDPAMA